MSRKLHLATVARSAALATAFLVAAALSAAAEAPNGYFATAGAPLVAPTLYDTGDAQATLSRQQASGYFATAGAPLVAPTANSAGDASTTLSRQRASGYFPSAGAPLVSPTTSIR